jgi:hypothetical protein
LLGLGFATIIAIALVCATFRIVRNHATFSDLEKMALGACACAGLPIVIAQLSGTNHLLRHISPAIVPLAIAIALLADLAGLIRSKAGIAVCSTLLIGQLLMILYPVFKPNSRALDSGMVNGTLPWRIFIRADQWNWMPVKELSDSCGVAEPTISYLGDGRTLNEAQIEFPWALKGLHADAQLLWRHEDGMIDWTKVMEKSSQSDLVVTAPGFLGDITDGDDLDNQSNADFNQRIQSNPVFQGPVHVHMGRFDPADVVVFVKRNLKCAVPTQEKANR